MSGSRLEERMDAPKHKQLSPRQVEVLCGIVAGKTNAQIGDDLGLSYETIKMHVDRIRAKLGVRTKTGIAAYAVRHNLVDCV